MRWRTAFVCLLILSSAGATGCIGEGPDDSQGETPVASDGPREVRPYTPRLHFVTVASTTEHRWELKVSDSTNTLPITDYRLLYETPDGFIQVHLGPDPEFGGKTAWVGKPLDGKTTVGRYHGPEDPLPSPPWYLFQFHDITADGLLGVLDQVSIRYGADGNATAENGDPLPRGVHVVNLIYNATDTVSSRTSGSF